jgi:hypothetical protein
MPQSIISRCAEGLIAGWLIAAIVFAAVASTELLAVMFDQPF